MESKIDKFKKLFKQESFLQFVGSGQVDKMLFDSLNEDDIERLLKLNTLFVRTVSPSSTIYINDINYEGPLTLINFDHRFISLLIPEERVAILLHEIGHVFNPEIKGIEGEYAADRFANSKGYGEYLISSLKRGVEQSWSGFKRSECESRINQIRSEISDFPQLNDEEE